MQSEKASAEALGIPEGLKGWGLLIGFEKKGLHKNNSDLYLNSVLEDGFEQKTVSMKTYLKKNYPT